MIFSNAMDVVQTTTLSALTSHPYHMDTGSVTNVQLSELPRVRFRTLQHSDRSVQQIGALVLTNDE